MDRKAEGEREREREREKEKEREREREREIRDIFDRRFEFVTRICWKGELQIFKYADGKLTRRYLHGPFHSHLLQNSE